MSKIFDVAFDEKEKMALLAKSLSSVDRIQILEFLDHGHLTVNEIGEKLGIPLSTAAMHVKVLEESKMIVTRLEPGVRGSKKVCYKNIDGVNFDVETKNKNICNKSYYINMPIGNYSECMVDGTCGMVSEFSNIGIIDDPTVFYFPNRTQAQLIWIEHGFLEYKFPISNFGEIQGINLSFEVCSEAPAYNEKWPSDITVWINGVEVNTWTSPGDFGGRRGKLNPVWWPDWSTQYGILKNYKVTKEGIFVDENKVSSDKNIHDLDLRSKDYATVKIGIKDDSKNKRGMNLFGEKFGDYNQNIVMRIDYNSEY